MLPETSVKHNNVWKLYWGKAFVSLSWFVLQRMLHVKSDGPAAPVHRKPITIKTASTLKGVLITCNSSVNSTAELKSSCSCSVALA